MGRSDVRAIAPTAVLAALAIAVSPSRAVAQGAELLFSASAGIVCPAAGALVGVSFFNRSGSTQIIEGASAGTVMEVRFPAPVMGANFSGSTTVPIPFGASLTRSGNTVTIRFGEKVTVQNNANSFALLAYLDLRGVRSGTPIAVTVTTDPPTAVSFEGRINTAVRSIVDVEACQPAPASALTLEDLTGRCPSAQEVAAFNAALQLRWDSDPGAGTLVCRAQDGSADLTRLQERTYQVLRVMKSLPFDTALPWTSKPLFDWFAAAIRGIRFRSDIATPFCCSPDGFINVQTSNLGVLTLASDPSALVNLAGVLAHEARHNEVGPHVCGISDLSLAELGPWGVQFYYSEWAAFRVGSFLTRRAPPAPYPYSLYRQDAWHLALGLLIGGNCDCGTKGALVAGVVASPPEVDFGAQALFAPSASRSVAITWTAGDPVTIREVLVSGTNASDFSVVGPSCVDTALPPSCPVVVRFTPSAAGRRTAELTANLSNGLHRTVELRGTGGT